MSNSTNVWIGGHVDRELRREVEELAHRHDRSVSAELRVALRQHVAIARGATAPPRRKAAAAA